MLNLVIKYGTFRQRQVLRKVYAKKTGNLGVFPQITCQNLKI